MAFFRDKFSSECFLKLEFICDDSRVTRDRDRDYNIT